MKTRRGFNIRLLDKFRKELPYRDVLHLYKETPTEYMKRNMHRFPAEARIMIVGLSEWIIVRPKK